MITLIDSPFIRGRGYWHFFIDIYAVGNETLISSSFYQMYKHICVHLHIHIYIYTCFICNLIYWVCLKQIKESWGNIGNIRVKYYIQKVRNSAQWWLNGVPTDRTSVNPLGAIYFVGLSCFFLYSQSLKLYNQWNEM